MKTSHIIALGFGIVMAAATVLPAAAATKPASQTSTAATTSKQHHTYFYVSKNPNGKGCEIVNHRPGTKQMVGKYYYATHKNAAAALKSDKVCRA